MIAPTPWLAAWVIYAAATLHRPVDGLWLASLVAAYAVGATTKNVKPIWLIAMAFLTANLLFCGYEWWQDRYDFGLVGNQNWFGVSFALAAAAAVAYDMLWFLPIAAVGIWFSVAVAAAVAGGFAVLTGLWRRFPALAVLSVLGFGLAFDTYPHSGSLMQRLGIWQDTLNHLTIFGGGYGAFAEAYKTWAVHTNMTAIFPPHAYNDYLELVFECGIGAIPLFIGIILALGHPGPDRLIIATFIILGLTYFPLSIPVVGHLFAMSLGHQAPPMPIWRHANA